MNKTRRTLRPLLSHWRSATTFLYALWVVAVAAPSICTAADPYSEDAVKAAFLYRFAGYVDWPSEALTNSQFTIAVLSANEVAAELERLLPGRRIKDKPSQVRKIKSVMELGDARILYVGARYAGDLRALVAAVARRPVLLVTDTEQGLNDGSTVNFLRVDQRVRFEVSLGAAERSGLKISSELLSVAARVQGGPSRSDISCIGMMLPAQAGLRCFEQVAER